MQAILVPSIPLNQWEKFLAYFGLKDCSSIYEIKITITIAFATWNFRYGKYPFYVKIPAEKTATTQTARINYKVSLNDVIMLAIPKKTKQSNLKHRSYYLQQMVFPEYSTQRGFIDQNIDRIFRHKTKGIVFDEETVESK